jgi:hypothetical protein
MMTTSNGEDGGPLKVAMIHSEMGVSINGGTRKAGWFIMEIG